MSRRNFLWKMLFGLGFLFAALIGIPVVGFVISPLFGKKDPQWVPVAWLEDLKSQDPQEVQFTSIKQDAWYRASAKQSVFILRQGENQFTVYSARCTHLGCSVHWDSTKNKFLCPCHGGQFDINGKVVSGPPPKPLNKLETKIENGRLFIKSV